MAMIKVDFHVHSIFSPDSVSDLFALHDRAKQLGLGKLVLTDHNTIRGALKFQKIHPDFVIVGEEIKTTAGEILALFVKEEIPAGLQPIEAFKRLRDQDAFISLSHPFAFTRHGWEEEEMKRYAPWLDAIEIANARCTRHMNKAAINFAMMNQLPGTAGSDSHGVRELGRMGLILPNFEDAAGLRKAIRSAEIFGTESPFFVRAYSRLAVLKKKLGRKAKPAD